MPDLIDLPRFPGQFSFADGCAADYSELARFHYRAGRPATWARVLLIRHEPPRDRPKIAAIGVLSYPTLALRLRERALGLETMDLHQRIRWVNENMRTISRIIVHPTYRSLGLASALVRRLLHDCPTRYVEALAAMGRAHPLFERSGMHRIRPRAGPVYYLFDRGPYSLSRSSSALANGAPTGTPA